MWTSSQRAVVLCLALGIFIYLSVRLAIHRTQIPLPPPAEGSRAGDLATRLDPNTATQPELAAIPNVGDKLASAITDYRDRFLRLHPDSLAFTRLDDLRNVRGIGTAKMETLSAYLVFPSPR